MLISEEMVWTIGRNMSLRSALGEALSVIKNGEGKVVAVMPIGASRSILYMLPAFVAAGGATVVVVLFVILRHDMKRCSEKVGVSIGEWDGKRSMDGKSIIFVTPEAAMREGFQTFFHRLRQTERLGRVPIDECYTILGIKADFARD
jgi:superfamily II DNA helicase RecQ